MSLQLEYNTQRPQMIIPEYGRHIQNMVDFAVSIEDREERNKVTKAIIGVMGNLNPHLRDVPDFQHKLWDQLFIISNFKLDVDSPFTKPSPELLAEKPEPLSYPKTYSKYRFYGNNIQAMIGVVNTWEEGPMKEAIALSIATQMKKSFLSWNKDTVEDQVIFEHLKDISGGKIDLTSKGEVLTDANELIRLTKKFPLDVTKNAPKKKFHTGKVKKQRYSN